MTKQNTSNLTFIVVLTSIILAIIYYLCATIASLNSLLVS